MIGGQEVGETNVAPGGWPAGRPDGGHVHKHALSGPNLQVRTCKIQTSWIPSWDRVWQQTKYRHGVEFGSGAGEACLLLNF